MLKEHIEHQAKAQALMDTLTDLIRKGGNIDTEQLHKLGVAAGDVAVSTPALRTNAWDTAIADQAVIYMNADELRRYSVTYATMRNIEGYSVRMITDNFVRDSADLGLAVKTGKADLDIIARFVSRYLGAMKIIGSHIRRRRRLSTPGARRGTCAIRGFPRYTPCHPRIAGRHLGRCASGGLL